jgi:hypothetical protein
VNRLRAIQAIFVNHRDPALRAHHVGRQSEHVAAPLGFYMIRINGRLGATALSAFPSLTSELKGGETVLTGLIEDRSALYGVLGQIEALGLELVELRQIPQGPTSQRSGEGGSRANLWR